MLDFDRHGLEGDGRCCCLREKEEGALPSLIELKEQKSDQKNRQTDPKRARETVKLTDRQ